MDKEERAKIEIKQNTINYLVSKLDKLLLGINTKKYCFKDKSEKEILVKRIRNYTSYRIKEKIIDDKSRLWRVVLEINRSNLKSKKEIEVIYLKILKLKYYDRQDTKILQLKYPLSKYYFEREKELGREKGKKALKEFLKMVEIITRRS